jgi:hypothetical protein
MVNDTRYTWANLSHTCFSLVPDSTSHVTNTLMYNFTTLSNPFQQAWVTVHSKITNMMVMLPQQNRTAQTETQTRHRYAMRLHCEWCLTNA